ncbi:hypothetical protein V5O48_010762 [Marasmius crinis-equi]|uniref:Uncharacterized protein n=1 Tax=Marasmius crinis-equi TaxID=585013 RepID=A0ABR3F7L2_9AGAR
MSIQANTIDQPGDNLPALLPAFNSPNDNIDSASSDEGDDSDDDDFMVTSSDSDEEDEELESEDKENVSTAAAVDEEETLEPQSDTDTMAIMLELAEAMRYMTRSSLAESRKIFIRLCSRDVIVRYEVIGIEDSDPPPSYTDAMAYVVKLAKCARYLAREQLTRNEKVFIEYTNDFLYVTYDGRAREGNEDERVWMSEFVQGPPLPGDDLSRTRVPEFAAALSSTFWSRIEREMVKRGLWDSGSDERDFRVGEPWRPARLLTKEEVASGVLASRFDLM